MIPRVVCHLLMNLQQRLFVCTEFNINQNKSNLFAFRNRWPHCTPYSISETKQRSWNRAHTSLNHISRTERIHVNKHVSYFFWTLHKIFNSWNDSCQKYVLLTLSRAFEALLRNELGQKRWGQIVHVELTFWWLYRKSETRWRSLQDTSASSHPRRCSLQN